MTHGLGSFKTPSRPAHQAIEKAPADSINEFQTPQRRMDNRAMRFARKAQNRMLDNEEKIPGSTIFSK
jgi:hypothetical protein